MMMTLAKTPSTQRRSIRLNMALDATGDIPVIRVFRHPLLRAWRLGESIIRSVASTPVKSQRLEHSMPYLVPARSG